MGTDGSDILFGSSGNDTLTGGAGADSFRFHTPYDGFDTITDFQPGVDRIEVIGPNFGNIVVGTLPANHFALDVPEDDDDWFVFNTASGILSFDADGSGAGAAVAIATLNVHTLRGC
ncbi:M10 family metallopeptidase C-terminal domain-containing protein [Azospirillum argentinense]